MRRPVAAAGAHRGAEDERAGLAIDIVELSRHVHKLVHAERGEVHEHDFDNGARAGDGGSDGHAGEGRLGNRRVADAFRAEGVEKPARDAEGAAIRGDVLAHDKDAVVFRQRAGEGVPDELGGREGAHAKTPSRTSSAPMVSASAKAMAEAISASTSRAMASSCGASPANSARRAMGSRVQASFSSSRVR